MEDREISQGTFFEKGEHISTTKCYRYSNRDKTLECELISRVFHVHSTDEDDENYTDRIEIHVVKGEDMLRDKLKKEKIADDFPIICKTEEEAKDILRNLLS